MSEELREGQRVRVTYDAVIEDVDGMPSADDPAGWLTLRLNDIAGSSITVNAPYTAARAITATEPSEAEQNAVEVMALLTALLNRDMPTSRLDLFRNAGGAYVAFTPDSTLDRTDPEHPKVVRVEPCADLLSALRALAASLNATSVQLQEAAKHE